MSSLIQEMSPPGKDWMVLFHDQLFVEILLAENSVKEALAVCKKESPQREPPALQYRVDMLDYNIPIMWDNIARAYPQNGELDKAIAEYENLVTFNPKNQDRRLVYPMFFFSLAKLNEEAGRKEKAIEHYKKFFDLWKDADPGIPEVKDARKRLAGLQHP